MGRSRKVIVKARGLGWNGIIAGTRKTTPGENYSYFSFVEAHSRPE